MKNALTEPMEIQVSLRTDAGCVRSSNEDCGQAFNPSDPEALERKGKLIIVADGMGGHLGGEVASNIAVETIGRDYYSSDGNAAESLRMSFQRANTQIYETARTDEQLAGMGTTCTALVLLQGQAIAAHVGDSRLYLIRAGEIYLMTEDHSAVREMVKLGIITAAEARNHEDKNVIIRALGTSSEVEVSMWDAPFAIHEGDQFVLCSDGLHDLVTDEEIRNVVLSAELNHSACEHLIQMAKGKGGHDNVTVAIVSIRPAGFEEARPLRETREVEVAI